MEKTDGVGIGRNLKLLGADVYAWRIGRQAAVGPRFYVRLQ